VSDMYRYLQLCKLAKAARMEVRRIENDRDQSRIAYEVVESAGFEYPCSSIDGAETYVLDTINAHIAHCPAFPAGYMSFTDIESMNEMAHVVGGYVEWRCYSSEYFPDPTYEMTYADFDRYQSSYIEDIRRYIIKLHEDEKYLSRRCKLALIEWMACR
jgi:hypothetical protein